jgi:hypothetical protein
VFGSHARGEATARSDIDLLAVASGDPYEAPLRNSLMEAGAYVGKTARVDPSEASEYRAVARALHTAALDLDTLGEDRYGHALAIVAIHAAIAYADAVSISYRGIKSIVRRPQPDRGRAGACTREAQ